jgi:hypothetical protein
MRTLAEEAQDVADEINAGEQEEAQRAFEMARHARAAPELALELQHEIEARTTDPTAYRAFLNERLRRQTRAASR